MFVVAVPTPGSHGRFPSGRGTLGDLKQIVKMFTCHWIKNEFSTAHAFANKKTNYHIKRLD